MSAASTVREHRVIATLRVEVCADRARTGLCLACHAGPFVQLECCGGWVCDTEGQYQMGSYERDVP